MSPSAQAPSSPGRAPDTPGSAEAPPKPLRVTKRRGQTRSRLLAAAAAVFAEQGFGRATVEDVCERAGYTRGAFYSNFASLDELFLALHTGQAAALIQAVESAVTEAVAELGAGGGDSGPPLNAVVDRVISALPVSQDYHLLNTEFAVHALRHPEVAEALTVHRRALRGALIPVLRMALGSRGAAASNAQLDDVARAVIAVQDGMALQELLEPGHQDLARLHRAVMSAVVGAI
jgi:AcrR family transcriptional regulator